MVFILSSFLLVFLAIHFYLKLKPKKIYPSPFNLSHYNSQQLSKLLGDNIIRNLKDSNGLKSIDEQTLPLRFQSQWCEDIILFEYFARKREGYYVEIGAFDGVKLSNTYFFECLGWKGILIEPQPLQFEECKSNRPYSTCINAAVSTSEQEVELTIVDTEDHATWSFIGKDDSAVKKYGFTTKKVMVPTIKISDLIGEKETKIDFMSIDVEGMELEILQTFNLNEISPEIILLENDRKEVRNYLEKFGYYLVYKTWINFFYCKNKEAFRNIDIWKTTDIVIKG